MMKSEIISIYGEASEPLVMGFAWSMMDSVYCVGAVTLRCSASFKAVRAGQASASEVSKRSASGGTYGDRVLLYLNGLHD